MVYDYKYHLEDSRRPLGTSLCGHVSYFAVSIVAKGQFDLLEPDEQCQRCISQSNKGFVPIHINRKGASNVSR